MHNFTRKFIFMLIVCFLLLGNSVPTFATNQIGVILNGSYLTLENPPIIISDRVFVPFRAILENMGYTIEWNSENKTILASNSVNILKLQIDSTTAILNNNPVVMELAPQIVNNRTMIPLRFVSEILGSIVEWDSSTSTVFIISSDKNVSTSNISTPTQTPTILPTLTPTQSPNIIPSPIQTPTQTPSTTPAPSPTLVNTLTNFNKDKNAFDIVKEMKVGWNLGNTLDAKGAETAWNNPYTTKEMIDSVKLKGFNTIRLPTTYDGHIGSAPDYTIDEAWLNRVKEVTDYVINNNMYAIINIHHEDAWLIPDNEHKDEVKDRLSKIWLQIASKFKDYDEHLIFEVMNEPRVVGSDNEWNGGTSENRVVINELNAEAVNAIRSTGDNNSMRFIMIPTHGASTTNSAINDLVIPNNDDNIIVSLHMYSPYNFAMNHNGDSLWGTDDDKLQLKYEFDNIYNKFIKNNQAVVITEWGSIDKDNLASRIEHAKYFVESTKALGITTVWWDNGIHTGVNNCYAIFDRNTCSWSQPELADVIVNSANEDK